MKELPLPLPGAEPRSLVRLGVLAGAHHQIQTQHRIEAEQSSCVVWWRNVAGTVPAETAPPSRQPSSEQRFRNRPGTHGQIKVKEDREREVLKCGGSTYTPSD
jgi:hypothetical protein